MISNINMNTAQISKVSNITETNKINPVPNSAPQSDHVSISDTAKVVMQSLQDTGTPVDIDKVMQLQVMIQTGNYQVESKSIADKLIQDATEL